MSVVEIEPKSEPIKISVKPQTAGGGNQGLSREQVTAIAEDKANKAIETANAYTDEKVEEIGSKKLDKITTPSGSVRLYAQGASTDGQTVGADLALPLASTPASWQPNRVPYLQPENSGDVSPDSGYLLSKDPINDYHTANKKYVDEKVAETGGADLQPLTFTGAVEATYDGKTPVTVEIPTGGGGGSVSYKEVYTTGKTTEAVSILSLTITVEMLEKILNADRVVMLGHIAKPTAEDTTATTRGTATFKLTNANSPNLNIYVKDAQIVPHPNDIATSGEVIISGIMMGERIENVVLNSRRFMLANIQATDYTQSARVNKTEYNHINSLVGINKLELSTSIPMGAGSYITITALRGDY